MKETVLRSLIKEELTEMRKEAEARYDKIEKKLNELWTKLKKELKDQPDVRTEGLNNARERRIQIGMVAEIIDEPVNSVMLYFINRVKNNPERLKVEYHLGSIYFRYDK